MSGVGWSPIPCIDGEIFLVGALRQGVDIAATWEHLPVGNPSSMKGGMPPHVVRPRAAICLSVLHTHTYVYIYMCVCVCVPEFCLWLVSWRDAWTS